MNGRKVHVSSQQCDSGDRIQISVTMPYISPRVADGPAMHSCQSRLSRATLTDFPLQTLEMQSVYRAEGA
jgi:hypothetical protein